MAVAQPVLDLRKSKVYCRVYRSPHSVAILSQLNLVLTFLLSESFHFHSLNYDFVSHATSFTLRIFQLQFFIQIAFPYACYLSHPSRHPSFNLHDITWLKISSYATFLFLVLSEARRKQISELLQRFATIWSSWSFRGILQSRCGSLVGFEAAFWVAAPCSLVSVHRCFRSTWCPQHEGVRLWNVGKLTPNYAELKPVRQPSSLCCTLTLLAVSTQWGVPTKMENRHVLS
jgi:hypothetical protein